ncbi:MAG: FG-GAP repeat domain-containing protein, partial [Rhodothermales bacterium]
FGDISGDGQKDLVAGPFWYEGPDFETKHTFYEPEAYSIEGYSLCFLSYVYDLDGDGMNDIFEVGFPGKASYWYKNPGSSGGEWIRSVAFSEVDNESPAFGDITGDGKPELIFLHGGAYGYAEPDWSNPTKEWTFRPVGEDRGLTKYTHGLGFGDVNGDGKTDLLEAKGWYEQVAGDGLWTYHSYEFADGGSQMFAYDFDGDGDQDVITGDMAHAWGFLWHENLGDESFQRHVIMGETPSENAYGVAFSQLHALALVDIDGDGIKDLVTGKRYWAHMGKDPGGKQPPVLYWFKTVRKKGGGVDFVPYHIGSQTGVGTQVMVDDYNGDGLPDIVVGNKKGTGFYTHKRDEVSKEVWQAAQPVLVEKLE